VNLRGKKKLVMGFVLLVQTLTFAVLSSRLKRDGCGDLSFKAK